MDKINVSLAVYLIINSIECVPVEPFLLIPFYGGQFVLICLINFENLGFTRYETAIRKSGLKFIAKLGSVALRPKEKLDRATLTQMLTG